MSPVLPHGGVRGACPDGHIERVWYNSCRHRFCPQCAQLQIAQWLERQKARLLRCDHYHVIFTVPSELHALWLANVPVFAHLLFRAAWETLSDLLGDPKYLGATPGMIAALHTWGQTLVLHPHLHCLVTGGGWDGAQWRAVRNGYLLPARVVMPVFRGKLLAALGKAVDAGQLTLPLGVTLPQQRMLLNRLGRQPWHVQIMTRYAHGQGVATYLARYLRGGPLKPARVVAWDDQTVTFQYADNQDPDAQGRGTRKLLPLSVEDFLQRWLLHVRPHPAYRSYAPMGCMPPASGPPWHGVGNSWGKGRWQPRRRWTGRRTVRSAASAIPSAARCVASGCSARPRSLPTVPPAGRVSGPGREHRPARCQRGGRPHDRGEKE